ncbi:MAG: hypothetical protein IPK79_07175 [Vampirovibrionales bacterium]|nr:hypothetical protein [Vampirovibrionales bacterium]
MAETFLGIAPQLVALNTEYAGGALFYAILSSILASQLGPMKAINA